MELPRFNKGYLALRIRQVCNVFDNFPKTQPPTIANIVDRISRSYDRYGVNRPRTIVDMNVISKLGSVAINLHRLVFEEITNHVQDGILLGRCLGVVTNYIS